ncbi:MAG: hypothetical protein ACI8QT_001892 [Halioglobus sp.]|jgi:hypothetical protein
MSMNISRDFSHCVTLPVGVTAGAALLFLADPITTGCWALGSMNARASDENKELYVGDSLFDGSPNWFSIEVDQERLSVDYLLGQPENLQRRINTRVVPAADCDLDEHQCYVTLTAWRPVSMPDVRWQSLCSSHEAEIWIIKSQMEKINRDA